MSEHEVTFSMSNFIRIDDHLPTTPFLVELEAASDIWLADTSRQRKVGCQRNTQNIFLRTPVKPLPPGARNANDVHESRVARAAGRFPLTLAFCEHVADDHDGTLGRATLVKLLPRSKVHPHVDFGSYYRIRDRFHLVLKSSNGSPLTAGNETVVMRPGELWVFNNKERHWADNPSAEPRVHLIFDVLPPPGGGFFSLPANNSDQASKVAKNINA